MTSQAGKLQGRRTGNARSPFRYPGGKAFFADFLASTLERLQGCKKLYLEPFAGGAGSAVRLLAAGLVDRIYLNDADPRIFCAWRAIIDENNRFMDALKNVSITMKTWHAYKYIVDNPAVAKDSFELGFATFFLNRTNRSGIIQGAGPIGGYAQAGTWKLDARFNLDDIISRVQWLGQQYGHIIVSNEDGIEFLKRTSSEINLNSSLYFIDPPYVSAGSRLYMNGMAERDHRTLAAYLCSGIIPNWIVTYDDCSVIRQLYREAKIETLDVLYSLQKRRIEGEVLITPN